MRDHAAFDAHWARIPSDADVVTRTIMYEGRVAGNVVLWQKGGLPHVGQPHPFYWELTHATCEIPCGAASLDGYIAGPAGEIDWIMPDPTIDWTALVAGFDTVLLGRRTYELTQQPGAPAWPPGWRLYVFSRTLAAAEHPGTTVVSAAAGATVAALRSKQGLDIWLFGGGSLCEPSHRERRGPGGGSNHAGAARWRHAVGWRRGAAFSADVDALRHI